MAHTFIRVKDRKSGAEFDLPDTAFREEFHTKVNAPATYPPLTTPSVRRVTARPAKHNTTKAGVPATKDEETGR